jgi:hypothetical protein
MLKHPYIDTGLNYFKTNKTSIKPNYYYNFFIKNGGDKKYKYKGYDFMVNKEYNKNNEETIFFIGKKNKCLIAKLDNNDNKIYIQSFGYYNDCSIGKRMNKGIGTKGVMYTFIHYIKKNYKDNVKYLILDDNAIYNCEGIAINMSMLYFFKYGDYYYSHKYGFELYDEDNDKLKKLKKNFKKSIKFYLDNQYIDNIFLEYFDNEFSIFNNKDEINNIRKKLKKYKSILLFMQKYKFNDCTIFNMFILCLQKYFNINSHLIMHKNFIYYL